MVARAAAAHCREIGDEVTALARADLDIADADDCLKKIGKLKPDAVINCAAYTDVDGSETNIDAAYAANSDGPANLAAACRESGAKLVTISTDYVFDGENKDLYYEDAEPNPLGVYGESKFDGEMRVSAANPDAIIVRSGWIYGHHGTNFLSVMPKLLADGKVITAISDSYGTPTFADDLAKRLRELAETDIAGFVHVTNAGDGTTYYGFAQEVCRIGSRDEKLVTPVSHADLKRPADRPLSSKLGCRVAKENGLAPLPEWREALAKFILDPD